MALALIGAGLGRTGTLSLKAALERIGYGPCYHMMEVLAAPERVRHWLEQTQHGSHDWDAIFHGYRATVDWPAAAFWREPMRSPPRDCSSTGRAMAGSPSAASSTCPCRTRTSRT